MDDDGLNMQNWGYYEPSFKEYIGLQLMAPFGGDHRDTKPFLSSRETSFSRTISPNDNETTVAGYHHHPSIPMHYMRDSWIQRDRLLHTLPGNPGFPGSSAANSIHIMPSIDSSNDPGINVDEIGGDDDNDNDNDHDADAHADRNGPVKRRSASAAKTARIKKPKKVKENANQTAQRTKLIKRNLDLVINGIDMDVSGIPIPVCSCTGIPQQCYRWGSGGWQSACCTTTISMYPLPMSTKRRGARIAGRKMSQGAFKKVLEKLASEGYNFENAIDLKSYWAKHGTNKFVTIR